MPESNLSEKIKHNTSRSVIMHSLSVQTEVPTVRSRLDFRDADSKLHSLTWKLNMRIS